MKKIILTMLLLTAIAGCSSDADIASQNLSKDADQFRVERRIVFYNGITNDYILVIEGKCSLGNSDKADRLTVTCKTGEQTYKKHFLGLSDNVTFFAEQITSLPVSVYQYKVIFKPSALLPNIEVSK